MPAKIFVNYRRDDVPGDARGVRDALAANFGKSNIFMDVDNLLVGQRFASELAKALDACDVFIVIIGPRWMEQLKARLVSVERDYVREEITAALTRKIAVIPVLVGRQGSMPTLPRSDELPEDIRDLVDYQKHEVAHERFGRDIADLIEGIEAVRNAQVSGKQPPADRAAAWAWMAGSVGVTVVFGYVVAYYAGVPIPWPVPRQPSQAGIAAEEKARVEQEKAEKESHQRIAALEIAIKREEEARTKAEVEAKQQAELARKTARDLDARMKAEAESKRQADEAERQQLAAVKVEQDRAKDLAEDRRRKMEAAERQQVAALKTEEPRRIPSEPMPLDVPADPGVLRVIESNPVFADMPAILVGAYRTSSSINWTTSGGGGRGSSKTDSDTTIRWLRQGIAKADTTQQETVTNSAGTLMNSTNDAAVEAANGLLRLGGKTTTRNRFGTTTTTWKMLRVSNLSGRIFPISVGNRFSYDTVTQLSSPHYNDETTSRYSCEVSKKYEANRFHSELKGVAYLIQCEEQTTYKNNASGNSRGELNFVFFDNLAYFIRVDPVHPRESIVLNNSKMTMGNHTSVYNGFSVLNSFSLTR